MTCCRRSQFSHPSLVSTLKSKPFLLFSYMHKHTHIHIWSTNFFLHVWVLYGAHLGSIQPIALTYICELAQFDFDKSNTHCWVETPCFFPIRFSCIYYILVRLIFGPSLIVHGPSKFQSSPWLIMAHMSDKMAESTRQAACRRSFLCMLLCALFSPNLHECDTYLDSMGC